MGQRDKLRQLQKLAAYDQEFHTARLRHARQAVIDLDDQLRCLRRKLCETCKTRKDEASALQAHARWNQWAYRQIEHLTQRRAQGVCVKKAARAAAVKSFGRRSVLNKLAALAAETTHKRNH